MKIFFYLFFLKTVACISQGTWIQKADFVGTARMGTVSFSIGTKGYIGTGYDASGPKKDLWEWNQMTNTWTQKASLPVGVAPRFGAVGFSIGTKGYIGTGYFMSTYLQDFWEWDQSTNTWAQKANFGGTARTDAIGFSIGAKGYIGTGYDGPSSYKQDFWEWDQSTNTWTQKAAFGGIARTESVGFSIGTKGYIGTGVDDMITSSYKRDFWEWDQSTNIWTQKADFGGTARKRSTGFSIGLKGYIGTGYDNAPENDFWEWDQATNVWTQKANFAGTARWFATSFSIGTKGYIGTGNSISGNEQDFWEYDICGNITVSTTQSNISCNGGNNGIINLTVTNGSGNFLYSWSNGATTQNVSGLTIGSYTVTIFDSTCNITITNTVNITQPTSLTTSLSITQPTCGNNNGSVTAVTSGGTSPYTYSWSSGDTTATVTGLTGSPTQTLIVTITDANNCTLSDTAIVLCITGVENYNLQNQFIISPNPNTGTFTISTKEKVYFIIITNPLGERILSQRIRSRKTDVDLSSYPNGIYFLHIHTSNGIAVRKIVKE